MPAALQGWKRSMVAVAAAAVLCAPLQQALALTLGRATVQSALGEPLRAEIELPDITEAEASTLQATIATPQAFRAAGLEYNPALGGIRIEQQRRADGRLVLRLASEQAVNDPFIDLILQANWGAGRAVRDYTLLLDPAPQRRPPAAAPTAPQLPPTPVPAPPAPPATSPAPVPPPTPAPVATPMAPAEPPAPSPAPPPPAVAPPPSPVPPRAAPAPAAPPTPAAAPAAPGAVTVRRGDTAGRLAGAHRPPNISLDQMLVAMLRSNPGAFIDGNVNRLRAGAVVELPSAEQAAATPAAEASRTIAAQARDFNAYRSQLAGQVPAVPGAAQRSASGRVQAQVDDSRRAATPDRLTLSKGGLQSGAQDERIAREKAAKEASERVAELSRNIEELNKLTPPPAAASAPAQAQAPAAPTPTPTPTPTPEPASTPAPAPEPTPPSAPAPAPESPASAAEPAAAAPPLPPTQDDAGLLGTLRDNTWPLAAGAAVLALLAALGLYRARQRRQAEQEEAGLQEPMEDAFFASSGGQHVDTGADTETQASAVYSPSQFDTSGEVDPVAEAEVYLAYGRDLQAEEILKEALRTTPERVAIHAKLAEIYAKRRDATALQAVAEQAHALTGGHGPEWDAIAGHGRELLPDHALWRGAAAAGLAAASASAAAQSSEAQEAGESLWPDSVLTPAEPPEPQPSEPQPPRATLQPMPDISLDLGDDDLPPAPRTAAAATEPAAEPAAPPMAEAVDFDFDVEPPYPASPSARVPAVDAELPPLDLGSLSLDLGEPAAPPAPSSDEPDADDPLATKLALAEEFLAIGDDEGARALAEEVLAEASGPLKARAQRFLAELG